VAYSEADETTGFRSLSPKWLRCRNPQAAQIGVPWPDFNFARTRQAQFTPQH